jgi:hypothetical protein
VRSPFFTSSSRISPKSRARDIAIARGDRIRITKNGELKVDGQAKGTKVNNGDILTVEGFTKDGDIRLEKGKIMPKDWGYAWLVKGEAFFKDVLPDRTPSKAVDRLKP